MISCRIAWPSIKTKKVISYSLLIRFMLWKLHHWIADDFPNRIHVKSTPQNHSRDFYLCFGFAGGFGKFAPFSDTVISLTPSVHMLECPWAKTEQKWLQKLHLLWINVRDWLFPKAWVTLMFPILRLRMVNITCFGQLCPMWEHICDTARKESFWLGLLYPHHLLMEHLVDDQSKL